jgi:hypothetical protein
LGKHIKGWWPYSEEIGTNDVVLGISINYQSVTILGFARLLEVRCDQETLGALERATVALERAIMPDGSFDWSTCEERLDHRGYPQVCAVMALVAVARLTGNASYLCSAERALEHLCEYQFHQGKFVFEPAPDSTGPAKFRDSTVQVSLFYLTSALRQFLDNDSFVVPYPG